ncbi:hypothetical protein OESDEN_02415 [Oesophagostomum dentatum]|uniref:RNA-directed DNA polymerase n=1 Tax=Oesophagostomum dentatum TaxID=61180 RepID=A0A0B1TP67_OESDE|nr:hypothetical protein OESDEN_02415 [Oesophagostomum dentatum]
MARSTARSRKIPRQDLIVSIVEDEAILLDNAPRLGPVFRVDRSLIAFYLTIYYPGLLSTLYAFPSYHLQRELPRSLHLSRPTSAPIEEPSSHSVGDNAIQLAQVQIHTNEIWPPRVVLSPTNVLTIRGAGKIFITQIPIRVEGISMLALVDTGAVITITDRSVATLLGVFTIKRNDVPRAVGMAGVPVTLLGRAKIFFEIGGITFQHLVYFTDAACIPVGVDSHSIILGNDVLARLPSWNIDYQSRTFSIGQQSIQILTPSPPRNPFISVRAAKTIVLRPAHIDDIVVFNSDFPSHLDSLRKVFERFRSFNVKASGKKLTEIARSHITFLGHEISGTSYSPAARNVKAIAELPTPTSTKTVKAFVGMANFFRKFIQNVSLIAAPLYELMKDKAKFVWGTRRNEAFLHLKAYLSSKPCLAFPQDKEFYLHTDGSQVAVGAALFRHRSDDDKELVAVGYFNLSGPFHATENGSKYILALIDHFFEYVIAAPLPDCTSVTVAHATLTECILKYGVMSELVTDNASYFKAVLMTELGRLLRIGRYFCTPHHHEGSGACERVFATFQPMLRTYINENQLDCVQLATYLLGKGIILEQICVISFYKEQFRRVSEQILALGIKLSTVDRIQGREKDVVILLTTKTDFDPESAEFLDNQKRMNVALTRSRHDQFVLGHAQSLRQVHFWRGVLEWTEEHHAVIPASSLSSFCQP